MHRRLGTASDDLGIRSAARHLVGCGAAQGKGRRGHFPAAKRKRLSLRSLLEAEASSIARFATFHDDDP